MKTQGPEQLLSIILMYYWFSFSSQQSWKASITGQYMEEKKNNTNVNMIKVEAEKWLTP
jgi:hypothetical protein